MFQAALRFGIQQATTVEVMPEGTTSTVGEHIDHLLQETDDAQVAAQIRRALGTWFGLACRLTQVGGRTLHLYDDDLVEETNLNRQVLFFDAVGRPKATALAHRLHRLFPRTRWCGYGVRVRREHPLPRGPRECLVACPHSFQGGGFLNDLARGRRQPLINGGTTASGGAVSGHVPGASACLSCLMPIERLAQRQAEPRPCGQVAEASVVTSNAIASALMAWHLR